MIINQICSILIMPNNLTYHILRIIYVKMI